jgi:hypothetical protein
VKYLLAFTLLLAACSPAATPAATAVRSPQTVTGSGQANSKPFALEGTYEVKWEAQAPNGCFHETTLWPVGSSLEGGGTDFRDLTTVNFTDGAMHAGSTMLYGVKAGSYYIRASSGCRWSFTFTPQ